MPLFRVHEATGNGSSFALTSAEPPRGPRASSPRTAERAILATATLRQGHPSVWSAAIQVTIVIERYMCCW